MKGKTKFIGIVSIFLLIFIFTSSAIGFPDTVWVDCLYDVKPATKAKVDVRLYTKQSLACLIIPLTFKNDENSDVVCDSIHWSKWFRSAPPSLGYSGADGTSYIDGVNQTILIWAVWMLDSLVRQDTASVICTIYFTTGYTWNPDMSLIIDTTFIDPSNTLILCTPSAQRLKPEFFSGGFFTDIREIDIEEETQVKDFTLFQNYPNPFNSATQIRFALSSRSRVRIEIFNILGQRIRTLANGELGAGCKEVSWDGTDDQGQPTPSGVYFCKIKAGEFSHSRKMLLLK